MLYLALLQQERVAERVTQCRELVQMSRVGTRSRKYTNHSDMETLLYAALFNDEYAGALQHAHELKAMTRKGRNLIKTSFLMDLCTTVSHGYDTHIVQQLFAQYEPWLDKDNGMLDTNNTIDPIILSGLKNKFCGLAERQ